MNAESDWSQDAIRRVVDRAITQAACPIVPRQEHGAYRCDGGVVRSFGAPPFGRPFEMAFYSTTFPSMHRDGLALSSATGAQELLIH